MLALLLGVLMWGSLNPEDPVADALKGDRLGAALAPANHRIFEAASALPLTGFSKATVHSALACSSRARHGPSLTRARA